FARHQANAPALTGLGAAFLGGLLWWAIGLTLSGLVLAAASASLLERVPLKRSFDASRAWLGGPQPLMRLRLLRGVLGALVGCALLIWPIASLTVAAWACGLVVAFAGLREGFEAALPLLPHVEAPPRPRRGAARAAPSAAAVAVVVGLAVILIGGTAWWVFRSSASTSDTGSTTACNGHARARHGARR